MRTGFIIILVIAGIVFSQSKSNMIVHLSDGSRYIKNTSIIDSITFSSFPFESILAYYPFNRNAKDESGNGFDGTAHGAELVEDRFGNPNSAYNFRSSIFDNIGINDKITINKFPFTFSCWVKPDSTNYISYIFVSDYWDNHYANYYGIAVTIAHATKKYTLTFASTDGKAVNSTRGFHTGNNTVEYNKWQHICFVYKNPSELDAYINGELIDATPVGNQSNTTIRSKGSNSKIGIAFQQGSDKWSFKGDLDDIAIYQKALSKSEVLNLYSQDD